MRRPFLLAALPILALCASARAGDVVGTVRFTGTPAPPATFETNKDRGVCGAQVEDESLLVSGGRVANVVVVVKGAPAPPPVTVTLDQQRCRYRPHVLVAPVGSTLSIQNGDDLLHSVHGWEGRMTRFDVVTPSRGDRIPTRLAKPGLIQVRCDVHSWMAAYVVVADAPALVTGPDGSFAFRGVPPGTYTLTAWHERLGERKAQITVPAQGSVSVDLAYGG